MKELPTKTVNVAATATPAENDDRVAQGRFGKLMRRRAVVCLFALSGLAATIYLARAPILTTIGQWLIYNDPVQNADYVAYLGGQDCCDAALNWLDRGQADSLLLWEQSPDRLVQLGIWKSALTKARAYIDSVRGLDSIPHRVLDEEIPDEHQLIKSFESLSEESRPVKIALLCREWDTRRMRDVVERSLASSDVQVAIYSVHDTPLTPSNWWHSRSGIRAVTSTMLKVCAARILGGRTTTYRRLNSDDFRNAAVARAR